MLHNNIKSMEMDNQEPQPDWYGFDRYRFRMVAGSADELVVSTPSDTARLIYREINEFYQFAAERGLPLIFVGQGYKHEDFQRKNAGYSSKKPQGKLPLPQTHFLHRFLERPLEFVFNLLL